MATRVVGPRLVGRKGQLARLGEALDHALGGRPSLVLVRGEAGVGKSRLLSEFVSAARSRGATTMLGGCLDVSAGDLPFVPIRTAFRLLIEERGAPEMARLLGPTASELHVLLPELAPAAGSGVDPVASGRHVFEVVSSVIDALARESCLVLAIDDVQWADVSTLQLVRYLTRQHVRLRLLVAVAYRGEELPADAYWTKAFEELSRSAVGIVDVPPLGRAEVVELVTSLRDDMTDDAVTRVVAKADGVPFLVEELVAAERDGLTFGVPTRFSEVLRLRIRGLSRPARSVVELVAASGRPAERRVVATAAGLSRRDFSAAVDEALHARVLVEDADLRTYSFRHDLAREVVYGDLRATSRSDLHARLAAALEAQLPTQPYATRLGEVAHHWLQTEDNEAAALRATLRAARASTDAYAHPEAARQYEHATTLWHRVDQPDAAAGVDLVTLLTEAAEAAHWAGQTDLALRYVAQALQEVDPEDDARVGGLHERRRWYSWLDTGHLAATRERDQITAASTRERMRASDLMQSGHYFDSIHVARQALQLARASGSSSDEIRASIILGVGLAMSGSVAEGITTIADAVAEAIGYGSTEVVIAGHVNLAFVLLNDGQIEEAARVALAGLDEADKRGAAAVDGAVLAADAALAFLRLGRLLDADQVVQAAMDRGPSPNGAAILALTRAEIDVVRGRLGEAEEGLRQIVRRGLPDDYQFNGLLRAVEADLQLWTPGAGPTIVLGDVLGGLGSDIVQLDSDGDVLLSSRLCWLGMRADADAAAQARVTASEPRLRDLVEDGGGLSDHVRALALSTLGDGARRQLEATTALVEAEQSRLQDEPAPDVWGRCVQAWAGEPYLQAYSLWRMGSALRAVRRRREAEDALREAHRIAVALGMHALVDAAHAGGVALGVSVDKGSPARRAPQATRPYNLTAKEMEVLQLLVAGGTNRRIASALFMTEKTASVHVSHILAKLSVTSRGEAIARAYDIGLARPQSGQQGDE